MYLHGLPALLLVLAQQTHGFAVGTSRADGKAAGALVVGGVDGAQMSHLEVRMLRHSSSPLDSSHEPASPRESSSPQASSGSPVPFHPSQNVDQASSSPTGNNVIREHTWIHEVSPNPHLTASPYYSRRISGTTNMSQLDAFRSSHSTNKDKHVAISKTQKGNDNLKVPAILIPGSSIPDWHGIAPKEPNQLAPGEDPWTAKTLQQSLMAQADSFGAHTPGQKDSDYVRQEGQMRHKCNLGSC